MKRHRFCSSHTPKYKHTYTPSLQKTKYMYVIRHIMSADVLCLSSLICQMYFILKRKQHFRLEPYFSQKQLQNCVSVMTFANMSG